MTKRTKNIEQPAVPASVREIVEGFECDLCHTFHRGATESTWSEGVEWPAPHRTSTAVAIGEAHNYPEGGWSRPRLYHVCPECFVQKLEPWLKSQGAAPSEECKGW